MDRNVLLKYETKRKCGKCKEYITLEKELDKVIYYKKSFYHENCFPEMMLKKKIGKLSLEEIEKLIPELKKQTEKHGWNLIVKNHLYKYLMAHYEVILLPNYIYTKMEDIFTGNYKNMSEPILPEHLLDMFQRQQKWLDGLYHKTKLDGVSRINYDLAVLIARYPGYLDWLSKSKQEAAETKTHIEKSNEIDFSKLLRNKKPPKPEPVGIFD